MGHHPARTYSDFASNLSFFVAYFIAFCFTAEMVNLYNKANSLHKKVSPKLIKFKAGKPILSLESLKITDQMYFSYSYEGVRLSTVAKSYFCRMYNFFFLLRFFVMIIIIFNAQWQQVFQVISSLIIQATFTILTFYYSYKHKFFNSKFSKYFRLTQEVSMCFIVLLINVFYYNNNF
jgi:hypothetical protein